MPSVTVTDSTEHNTYTRTHTGGSPSTSLKGSGPRARSCRWSRRRSWRSAGSSSCSSSSVRVYIHMGIWVYVGRVSQTSRRCEYSIHTYIWVYACNEKSCGVYVNSPYTHTRPPHQPPTTNNYTTKQASASAPASSSSSASTPRAGPRRSGTPTAAASAPLTAGARRRQCVFGAGEFRCV